MSVGTLVTHPEHLSPHDLVTYSRCPYEMELQRARHRATLTGTPVVPRTPLTAVPLRHSPLFTPPTERARAIEGRFDVRPGDRLVYADPGERDLPVLFAPEQVSLDPRFLGHAGTLLDDEFGISGRPDFVVRSADGALVPVEYKSTHLFLGYHEVHGRAFDVIQAIGECRLVHAAFGVRPTHGVILYGDAAGDGRREGFVEVPYGDAEEHWLRAALVQIRSDDVRAPVPSESHCAPCEPNRAGECRFAAVPPGARGGLGLAAVGRLAP